MEEKNYTTSKEAFEAIKQFEGLRLEAYKCPGGVWTIGYGHTKDVLKGDKIDEWYAEYLLDRDLQECECEVNALGVCKTQGQFDALVDFVYNLGPKRLQQSTLLRYIRMGCEDDKIQSEFLRWRYSGKKKLPGLERRCEWRAQRWVS